MRRGGLYGLFFLSGVSALVYELVWQRLLNLVFGVSTLSVSAVLAAFMGGLALGGLLLGRWADRLKYPWRFYAALEVGIAVTGLLVPPAFAGLTSVYTFLHTAWGLGLWGGTCLRFGLACLVLLVPASLIGGTLPVMARLIVRRTTALPTTFSLFYAVNTLGGVAGASLTGFLLLRYWGMQHTLWLAAGLNLLVALGAVLLQEAVSVPPAGTEAASAPARPPVPVLPLALAGIMGAIGLAFEVA
jgi:predicted membrane-bound spermidine synthase